jgi:2,3-bisphosphoglycerate-independent phosphoglycerate mutase
VSRLANQNLKRIILEVVNNQIRDNDPPITKVTLERLKKSGYTEQQAKEKIASILIEEIYDVLKNHEVYNEERYANKLSALK